MMFGDDEVARLRSQFWNNVCPASWRGLSWHGHVNDWTKRVLSVRRRSNSHQKDRHAIFPTGFGQSRRVSYHYVRGMGSRLPSDDAFLEIYDHQRRFRSVDCCIAHKGPFSSGPRAGFKVMEIVRMAHLGRIISKRSRVRQYQCGEAIRPIRKSLSVRTRFFSASNNSSRR